MFSLDTYCCQLIRLFSRHARLALARATLKLRRFSVVILVLNLTKADFLAYNASLQSVLNQGLQRFFCFAVVLGMQLLVILHKTTVNKTIGSLYNSIVSNENFSLHKLSICTQSARFKFQRSSASRSETPIFLIIGK